MCNLQPKLPHKLKPLCKLQCRLLQQLQQWVLPTLQCPPLPATMGLLWTWTTNPLRLHPWTSWSWSSPTLIKFKCSVNDNQYDEIITYNGMLGYI